MCICIDGHPQTNKYKCNIDINNNKKSHAPACGGFPEARHFPSHYRSCHFGLRLHYILVQSETKVNEKLRQRNYISFCKIFGFAHLKPKHTFVLRHTCVLACRHTFDTVGSGTLLTMVRLKHVALFCGTLLTLWGGTLCHRSGCTCPCGKRGGGSRPGRDKKEIFRQIIHWR